MSDVFSRRNLPGSAETWGREVEKRVEGVERNALVLSQDVASQNRNTAASLQTLAEQQQTLTNQQQTLTNQQQTLAEQVSDLAERNSYVASTPILTPITHTTSGTRAIPGMSVISFSLSRPRMVTVSLKGLVMPTPGSGGFLAVYANGNYIDPYDPPEILIAGNTVGFATDGHGGAVFNETYLHLQLPAGPHNIQGYTRQTGSVSYYGLSLSVNVLQPLD